eukprot:3467756-Ditylum_brightwellii.AAC.1
MQQVRRRNTIGSMQIWLTFLHSFKQKNWIVPLDNINMSWCPLFARQLIVQNLGQRLQKCPPRSIKCMVVARPSHSLITLVLNNVFFCDSSLLTNR